MWARAARRLDARLGPGRVFPLAAVLTGGIASPLAVWCLAPMLAAGLLAGPHRLAQGAALSLMAVAATALAQAVGLVGVQPTGALELRLGFTGLTTTAVGAAAALEAMTRRREAKEAPLPARRSPPTAPAQTFDEARAILDGQPFLVLVIGDDGVVERRLRPCAAQRGTATPFAANRSTTSSPFARPTVRCSGEALREGLLRSSPRGSPSARPARKTSWLALDAARPRRWPAGRHLARHLGRPGAHGGAGSRALERQISSHGQQVPFPRQHEPRAAHAAERHHRLLGHHAAEDLRRTARQVHGIRRADPRGRRPPAGQLTGVDLNDVLDMFQDRGGALRAEPRGAGRARADLSRPAADARCRPTRRGSSCAASCQRTEIRESTPTAGR